MNTKQVPFGSLKENPSMPFQQNELTNASTQPIVVEPPHNLYN
jgi:hypothetical protein